MWKGRSLQMLLCEEVRLIAEVARWHSARLMMKKPSMMVDRNGFRPLLFFQYFDMTQ